jgi:hypothetical protein
MMTMLGFRAAGARLLKPITKNNVARIVRIEDPSSKDERRIAAGGLA